MYIAQNKHFFYKEKEQNDKNRDTELALQRKLEKKSKNSGLYHSM